MILDEIKDWCGDQIVKVDLPIPEYFHKITNQVEEMIEEIRYQTNNTDEFPYVIAGGCLSNLYINQIHGTNYEVEDIDIFVEAPIYEIGTLEREAFQLIFGKKMNLIEKYASTGYESLYFPMIYQYEFEGKKVEIVFCSDLKRVFDFDLGFRHFYAFGKEVYAHKKAIEDVNERKISIIGPVSPVSTFARMKHFEEKFGFTVEPESDELIRWLLSQNHLQKSTLIGYAENREKMSSNVKNAVRTWANTHLMETDEYGEFIYDKSAKFPYDHSLRKHFISDISNLERNINLGVRFGLWGKYYEKIISFKHKLDPVNFKIYPSYLTTENTMMQISEILLDYIIKNRLDWMVTDQKINFKNLDIIYEILKSNDQKAIYNLLYKHEINGLDIHFEDLLEYLINEIKTQRGNSYHRQINPLDQELARMGPIYVTSEITNYPYSDHEEFLNDSQITLQLTFGNRIEYIDGLIENEKFVDKNKYNHIHNYNEDYFYEKMNNIENYVNAYLKGEEFIEENTSEEDKKQDGLFEFWS
jgi:hypothetical protein